MLGSRIEDNKFVSQFEYDRCLVVFIDILGWKDIIEESRDVEHGEQEAHINELFAFVQMLQSPLARRNALLSALNSGFPYALGGSPNSPEDKEFLTNWHHEALKFQISQFSDCVLLSAPADSNLALQELWPAMYQIFQIALRYGVLLRGGIAVGDIIHEQSVVFGPGLVDAYLLEKKARMPRILISKEALELLQERFSFTIPVKNSDDGRDYLDIVNEVSRRELPHTIRILEIRKDRFLEKNAGIDLDSKEGQQIREVIAKYDWYMTYLKEYTLGTN